MWVGWVASAIAGFGMPSFVFLIGDVINSFNSGTTTPEEMLSTIRRMSLIFLGVGIAVWIASYVSYAFLLIFSERVIKKTRVKYLESILK